MSASEYPGAVSANPRVDARNTSAPSNRFDHLRWTAKPFPSLYGGGPTSFSSRRARELPDRKSTRLNSSHLGISYAVFCLKKKKKKKFVDRSAIDNITRFSSSNKAQR